MPLNVKHEPSQTADAVILASGWVHRETILYR